ncbi:MAG: hypothetical protein HYX32_13420 [Actinobacteria bacterium]|nr:hypothetical protein [Actinomycetota bacterium]
MADDESVDRSEWLVPPAADEIRVLVELGDEVDLTSEQTDALERLVEALDEQEVAGFAMGGAPKLNVGLMGGMSVNSFGQLNNSSCDKFTCNRHSCGNRFTCDTYSSALRLR